MTATTRSPVPATADLCDRFPDEVALAEPILRDFGGLRAFAGRIETVQVFEDNVLVRQALDRPGVGCVLVVDGGASLRCALLGDQIAQLAADHGWAGVVIHGAIRDSAQVARMPLGVRALGTCPLKSRKEGSGRRDVVLRFAGASFHPGHWVYADADGLLVAPRELVRVPGAHEG